jgi:hypothetical protein
VISKKPVQNEKRHPQIGTLQETSLHADLKDWYAQPDDRLEVPIDGFVVDIVRGDLLIEIQTRHFSALKTKLNVLAPEHPTRLVFPIAQDKWITRLDGDGKTQIGRRKSPKRGRVEHMFIELVRFPQLITNGNFSLEVLLIQEEEIWLNDGQGSWRRKGWSIHDRKLIRVLERVIFESPQEFAKLLPPSLPRPFTTLDLARALKQPRYLAQKMAYCLRAMGVIQKTGKKGNSFLYEMDNPVAPGQAYRS